MSFTMAFLAMSWIGVTGAGEKPAAVEMRPAALTLEAPPAKDVERTCVLRYRGGAMNILSVAASDPAITVDLRQNPEAGTWAVTATLPAGYPVTAGREPVNILVRTDLPKEPLIRIPVQVRSERKVDHDVWLAKAKTFIGQPWPEVTLDQLDGDKVEIKPVKGKVTVVVFSAHWCLHCDKHVPVIEGVWRDYTERNVQFFGIAAGAGNGKGIQDAAERWTVDWPVGVDWDLKTIQQFGVKAFPVVFVIDSDGTIVAVHGRWANRATDNGLDDLDMQLRMELEILLSAEPRPSLPDWENEAQRKAAAAAATRPAPTSTRPAESALVVAPEVRGVACKPGTPAVFHVPVRNIGMRPLKLIKVNPVEGVTVAPDYPKEIPPGGLSVLRCEVIAPAQPGAFSRRIEIQSDAPRASVGKTTLAGTASVK